MASLISPGVSVSIIDESQYTPTQAGSIPFVLLATAQNKTTPSGTVATGTTLANAEQILTVTSQRDLVNQFGTPTFQLDASGNPINASELNEYGLLAAYSALGVTNQLYVQRANIDLDSLVGTSIRPTGTPADGTFWLDLNNTSWGIYEWDSTGFNLQSPLVITNTALLSSGVPLTSVGSIGQYAVVATSTSNPIYYKGYNNNWVLVGTDSWKSVTPTVVGQISNPGNLSTSQYLVINSANVQLTAGANVAGAASSINSAAIAGVSAAVNSVGQLEIYANSASKSNGVTADGKLSIAPGTSIGHADAAIPLGLLQSQATVVGNTYVYYGPTIQFSQYTNPPAWLSTDTTPRPYGSVWFKTSAVGNGANWAIKEYSASLNTWSLLAAPFFDSDSDAIYGLDPAGGGAGLAVGTTYVQYDTLNTVDTQFPVGGTFKPFIKNVNGVLVVSGTAPGGSPFAFRTGDSFGMSVSVPGTASPSQATITIGGSGNANPSSTFVSAVLAANLPNISASVDPTTGIISIVHGAGGTIQFTVLTGTPLTTAGLLSDSNVQTIVSGSVYLASPFTPLTYTYSTSAPSSNPADGTLWYYSNPLDVDIMINTGSGWAGYQTVASDSRGYNLQNTDATGVILSATHPTTQVSGAALVSGDLWLNTSNLENYPVISRYNATTSSWTLINNTDDISSNGIVFADARWATNGNTNPITATLPTTVSLLTSSYTDPDCPSHQLYARGTLLFNTRRSGYNIKRFESQWFATATNPPAELGAWVTHSGDDPTTGIPYFGHKAQRNSIVQAMKSAIASSTKLREEQTAFNLICAPGYPELIQDMVTLNDDRLDTAFIIGDSPLTLSSDSTALTNWATNAALAVDNGTNGLVTYSDYLAVYYPSGLATNLDGSSVVVPASHMMLRAIIRSDNVAYPWFAPAGVRRGLIDNVSSIGYVDITNNNNFVSIGVTNGLRDVLYANEVNPITVLPGVGLVAYGQKTRASTASAMDRINVARLVCYLRTVLAQVAAPYIFEPNDTITRNQVQAAFNAVLNDVVAKRGIYDFLVVCDTTNNTPTTIDANELHVDIAIQPVKAIEFIYIPVRLLNTGAALTIA